MHGKPYSGVALSMSVSVSVSVSVWGLLAAPAFAQEQALPLDSVVVLGEKVQPEAQAKPLTVVDREELRQRQATTLGETLRGLPGVSATGFGPNASRPIIRGQDGDRVKLLQNSAPVSDASAMSFDHAVGVNPYAMEQVEILRGPSALLYGGSAVGGVVNLVNRRILRQRVQEPGGSVDVRADSGNHNRQAAFEYETPVGTDWFVHLDGVKQQNGDTRTPEFTDTGEEPVTGRRIRNSAAQSSGLGFGLSRVTSDGHWGASIESDASRYGVPKETDTTIDLRRHRLSLSGDQALAHPLWERLRLRAGVMDYQHQELSAGALVSTFKNQAQDLRLELSHGPLALWQGLVGVQWERAELDVQAVEEDPLLPRTQSPKAAVFVLEERPLGPGRLRLGARLESARVTAAHTMTVSDYGASDTRAGHISTSAAPQTARFAPLSASLEYSQPVLARSSLGVSLSHVERAPSNYELFAMGIHHASGLFEAGNPALGKEQGQHLDLSLNHRSGSHRFKASAFCSRYSNYLTLIRRGSGETDFHHEHEPGVIEPVPVYDYSGVGARFHGLEMEYSTSYTLAAWKLKPQLVYDRVLGSRTSNGAAIARMTPERISVSVSASQGPWLVRTELQWVGRARLGENETVAAPGYTLLHLLLQYKAGQTVWFLKGSNLGNRLAYNASTVNEVRAYAPIAGRSLQAGVRVGF